MGVAPKADDSWALLLSALPSDELDDFSPFPATEVPYDPIMGSVGTLAKNPASIFSARKQYTAEMATIMPAPIAEIVAFKSQSNAPYLFSQRKQ